MSHLNELCKIAKVQQFYTIIDPLYQTYDEINDAILLNIPPRTRCFNFSRPHKTTITKWDSYTANWETIVIDSHESYYVPNDFYDFYYSPIELDSLNIDKRKKLIKEMFNSYNELENAYTHWTDYYINGNNVMDSIQLFIKKTGYHIVNFIPYPDKFLLKQYSLWDGFKHFDETWNTANYFHMLIPRKKTYYINAEKLTCTCKNFKYNKTCDHIIYYALRRALYVRFNNIRIVIDICQEYFNINY